MSFEWRAMLVIAVLVAALLAVAAYAAVHQPPKVCVSSVGPVDRHGHGTTTPEVECR